MPLAGPEPDLVVEEVRSGADLDAFVRLPHVLYRGDPHFVPPLNRDIRLRLDPRKHPYFLHAEAALFLARRGGRVVGRIAATVNRLHNEFHHEKTGFFGFFETIHDQSVARALIERAAAWLRARGQTVIRGPASFSSNDEWGLLIGGEPGPPALMMPHNPLWYAELLEGCGLRKAMDLFAWDMAAERTDLARWERMCDLIARKEKITVRTMDMRRFDAEVRAIQDIYRDAWAANWGFVPMTDAEFAFMAKELKPVVVPKACVFIVKDGRDVGFALALPDLNRIIIKLGGRLFPTGLIRILLGKNKVGAMRLLTLGVRREFQGRALDAVLYHHISANCIAAGMPRGEMSWVLETNGPMNNALERAGGRMYRTYRVFDAPL